MDAAIWLRSVASVVLEDPLELVADAASDGLVDAWLDPVVAVSLSVGADDTGDVVLICDRALRKLARIWLAPDASMVLDEALAVAG